MLTLAGLVRVNTQAFVISNVGTCWQHSLPPEILSDRRSSTLNCPCLYAQGRYRHIPFISIPE